MADLFSNIWAVYLDTAFWLLLGLFAAGLIKVYIPENAMQRWLGGKGFSAVGRAALFGAPLPLCSCGVLPAALGLRRSGASKEATVSFLISTPETSIDSVAVTYALMGPLMAVYRPVAALVSAMITGMMTLLVDDESRPASQVDSEPANCCGNVSQPEASQNVCCSASSIEGESRADSCCPSRRESSAGRLLQAFRFASGELLDDISHWLFIGIVVAGIITTVIPPGWLEQWGQGLAAMLVMAAVGVPMYICAVASTPVAAGLLVAGVSPGTVLVFLLVGPATNIAGLILVNRELGRKVTLVYLAGITLVSIIMGLLLDWLIEAMDMNIVAELGHGQGVLPGSLAIISAILLLILAVPFLRKLVFPFLRP